MSDPIYPQEIQKAHAQAIEVKKKAHAPYSQFHVGAVIKFIGEKELIEGCNVENASYPAGLCAERTGLFASVAKFGKKEIEWIVIVTNTHRPSPPCGMCLQAMTEFSQRDFPLYLGNEQKILKCLTFRQLLPHTFDTLGDQVT